MDRWRCPRLRSCWRRWCRHRPWRWRYIMFWRFVEAHIRTTIVTAKSTSWAVNVLNNWIQYTCKAPTKGIKIKIQVWSIGFYLRTWRPTVWCAITRAATAQERRRALLSRSFTCFTTSFVQNALQKYCHLPWAWALQCEAIRNTAKASCLVRRCPDWEFISISNLIQIAP